MGGGGGGGELVEVDLSRGAVAALWRSSLAPPARPVLQVADVRGVRGRGSTCLYPAAADQRYRLLLSDGVHSHPAMLATYQNHFVRDGALRRGSVVRLLDYICSNVLTQRVVIIIQLEILQTECALIGNPISYEASATQPNGVSCPDGLGSWPCFMPVSQEVVNSSPSFPGHGMLDSSLSPRAKHAMSNQPFGGYFASTPPHNKLDSKMQQLSLNDHQNQMFAVATTGGAFGSPVNAFKCPMPPSYGVVPPMFMGTSPVARDESAPRHITPVAQLNPYQAGWTIKARVTAKTDIRHFKSARGSGAVFSFDLLDAQGGEIRVRCFNLRADQYFGLIEVDKVYLISKGSLKPAQKKFNPLNHEYEIYIDHKTSIEICSGDDSNIPRKQYNFRCISEIENLESGDIVDLIGIVTSVGPCVRIMRKDGKETQNRTLQLKDLSGSSVEVSFWGKFCDAEGKQLQFLCDSGSNPVLALKGGLIIDFTGRSVATVSSTQLKVNPDFPEAERLRQWYVSDGKIAPCISRSRELSSMSRNFVQKTIAQIKNENLGRSEKPYMITVRAVISNVNAAFCYPACILEVNGMRCNKKLSNNGDGTWYCDKCAQNSGNCEYKFWLRCQINDHTGTAYAIGFQVAGEAIFGHTAQELVMIRDEEPARFTEIMQGALSHEYLFKIKIFGEAYRVRCCIMAAEKLNAARNHSPLDEMDSLSKDGSSCTPKVGSANPKAGQIMQTSSSANDVDGADYAHLNRMSTPLSASSKPFDSSGTSVFQQGMAAQVCCASHAVSLGTGLATALG